MKIGSNPILRASDTFGLIILVAFWISYSHASIQTEGRAYLITNSGSKNVTTLNIVNSSPTEQQLTGTLYAGSGEQLGPAKTPLHPGVLVSQARLTLSASELESLFGVERWSGPAMLIVHGQKSLEIYTKLQNPGGLTSNTNCVTERRVLNIEGFDSPNMTYVRFINTLDKAIGPITATLYDIDGEVLGEADKEILSSLSAHQQVWLNRNDLRYLFGTKWTGEAMLEVGRVRGLKLLNLNYITSDTTFFNFSCMEDSSSGQGFLQTTSSSKHHSLTHIVNTANEPQVFMGTVYDSDGNQLGEDDQLLSAEAIPAKGRLILSSTDIETIFGIEAWRGPALLEVEGPNNFNVMTKLTSPSGLISNTNCVRRRNVHGIESLSSSSKTYIRFINSGTQTIRDVRGTLFDQEGNLLGQQDTLMFDSLDSKQARWLTAEALGAQLQASWDEEVTLIVTAEDDTDLRLMHLGFINKETFFNFSCYETDHSDDVQLNAEWETTPLIIDDLFSSVEACQINTSNARTTLSLDFNQDGQNDILISAVCGNGPGEEGIEYLYLHETWGWGYPVYIEIYLSQPDGGYEIGTAKLFGEDAVKLTDLGGGFSIKRAADMNGDSYPDLLVYYNRDDTNDSYYLADLTETTAWADAYGGDVYSYSDFSDHTPSHEMHHGRWSGEHHLLISNSDGTYRVMQVSDGVNPLSGSVNAAYDPKAESWLIVEQPIHQFDYLYDFNHVPTALEVDFRTGKISDLSNYCYNYESSTESDNGLGGYSFNKDSGGQPVCWLDLGGGPAIGPGLEAIWPASYEPNSIYTVEFKSDFRRYEKVGNYVGNHEPASTRTGRNNAAIFWDSHALVQAWAEETQVVEINGRELHVALWSGLPLKPGVDPKTQEVPGDVDGGREEQCPYGTDYWSYIHFSQRDPDTWEIIHYEPKEDLLFEEDAAEFWWSIVGFEPGMPRQEFCQFGWVYWPIASELDASGNLNVLPLEEQPFYDSSRGSWHQQFSNRRKYGHHFGASGAATGRAALRQSGNFKDFNGDGALDFWVNTSSINNLDFFKTDLCPGGDRSVPFDLWDRESPYSCANTMLYLNDGNGRFVLTPVSELREASFPITGFGFHSDPVDFIDFQGDGVADRVRLKAFDKTYNQNGNTQKFRLEILEGRPVQ